MLYGLNESNNPRLMERVYIDGTIGRSQTINVNRPVTCIVASVKNGAVDVFIGDGNSARRVPDLHFNQSGKPVTVPFTGAPGQYTVVASDPNNPTLACVMFGGP